MSQRSNPEPTLRPRLPRKSARGIALVTTVWLSLFIALTAATVLTATRTESSARRNAADLMAAREIAKAGLHLAIHDITAPVAERSLPRDGRAAEFELGAGTLRIAIEDERGKLDLRLAPPQHVQALLRTLGARSGLDAFDAVALSKHVAAALGTTRPGDPRTANLHTIGALAGIPGLSDDLLSQLSRHATIFGFGAHVNPQTASRDVLASITGMDARAADAIIAAREQAGSPRPAAGAAEVSFTNLEGPVYTIRTTGRLGSGIEQSLTAVVGSSGIGLAARAATISILELR